jgi:hypothetical protein
MPPLADIHQQKGHMGQNTTNLGDNPSDTQTKIDVAASPAIEAAQ